MNPERNSTEEQGGTTRRSRPSSSTLGVNNGDMKRAAKQLIERYFYQIKDGCGLEDCKNEHCASSALCAKKNLTNDEAGLHAIELFKQKAKLCDSRPSKVARANEASEAAASSSISVSAASASATFSASLLRPSTSTSNEGGGANPGFNVSAPVSDVYLTSARKPAEAASSVPSTSSMSTAAETTIISPSRSRSSPVKATKPASATDTPHPPFLTEARLHEIIETCDKQSDWSLMIRTVGSVFNNADSLVKSFRKSPMPAKKESEHWLEYDMDKDRDESEEEPMEASNSPAPSPHKLAADEVTLDLESVRRSFKELFSISGDPPFIHAMIYAICTLSKSLEVDLRYYKPFEVDPNYLNIFLIILEIPNLHSTEFLESAFPKFCRALGCLPVKAQAKLARVLSGYPIEKLRDFLDNLQQLITVKTVSTEWHRNYCVNDDDGITGAAKVLKILFYACVLSGRLDPPHVIDAEQQLAIEAEEHMNEILQGAVGREAKEKSQPKDDPLGKELGINAGDCREAAIPWADFINESLSDAIEMDKDYTYYKADTESKFTFMTHSFLLTTTVKSLGLYFDNRIRMMNERRTSLLQSLVRGAPTTPYLRLRIRRDHIIDDSLVSLEMTAMDNPQDLKKQLYVEFEGEQGIDEGGVSKEFFQLVVEEIFNPDIGMFTYNEETHTFWFNPTSFENDGQFMLIGIVLGIAIYNNVILDIHFPMVVYRKLMGKKGTFEDLEFSHPTLFNSLKSMLSYEGDVESTFMQTFKIDYKDVFGSVLSHELKEGGDAIPVTTLNREEFVELYAEFLLNKSIEKQFKAFFRGFQMVTDESPLKNLFRPEEIELLVCGSQNLDFNELEKGAEYDGGFTAESQTIILFWEIVHALDEEQKRKLLQFTTGSDRVPIGGLSKLKLIIAKNGPDSDRLPTSHTCFNVLLLPDYQNRAKLEERLLKAITYAKGFGML